MLVGKPTLSDEAEDDVGKLSDEKRGASFNFFLKKVSDSPPRARYTNHGNWTTPYTDEHILVWKDDSEKAEEISDLRI